MAAAIPSARWVPLWRAASFSMRRNLFTVGLDGAVAAVIVVVTVVAAKAAVMRSGRGCNFSSQVLSKLEATSSYFRRYTLEQTSNSAHLQRSPAAPNASVTCEHLATPVTDKRAR